MPSLHSIYFTLLSISLLIYFQKNKEIKSQIQFPFTVISDSYGYFNNTKTVKNIYTV